MLAAILASGDPERLYTGLSLLVSTASAGEEARALATFGALGALLDPDLATRARAAAHVIDAERAAFAQTLAALRDTAAELPNCRIWACSAAVQTTGADLAGRLDGVLSTPAFLREVAGARLVVV